MRQILCGGLAVFLLPLAACDREAKTPGVARESVQQGPTVFSEKGPAANVSPGAGYTSSLAYTTSINPAAVGFAQESPETTALGRRSLYREAFHKDKYAFLVARIVPISDDLNESFLQLLALNAQMAQQALKPGQGHRIVGEGNPKPIILDGMRGLKGGAQLWDFNSENDLLNDTYTNKLDIRLAIASNEDYLYTFTLVSTDRDDDQYTSVVSMFDDFVASFHDLAK